MGKPSRLLFIVADRLSKLVQKGEITARYYNPGDLFDEVHLLTTSNDLVEPQHIALAAGRAKVEVHRLWEGSDRVNMSLSPLLERRWIQRVKQLCRTLRPDLVRSGDRLTGYLANCLKREYGIPHILSLHSHRQDLCARTPWGPYRLMLEYEKRYARRGIGGADAVIIVYEALREYAAAYGARRIEPIYNVISPQLNAPKEDYALGEMPQILCVGRQIPRKNPEHLVRAMQYVQAQLTLVGDGPLHGQLKALAQGLGLADRVRFLPAMANRELCQALGKWDLFAAYSNYPEVPKTYLEALWFGLPLLVNRDRSRPVPELEGDWVMAVENTTAAYAEGLQRLLADRPRRQALGQRGRRFAAAHFAPDVMEDQLARLYSEIISKN